MSEPTPRTDVMKADVFRIDGKSIGAHVYLSINGCLIADVFAGPYFGPDEELRKIALANAEKIALQWNTLAARRTTLLALSERIRREGMQGVANEIEEICKC